MTRPTERRIAEMKGEEPPKYEGGRPMKRKMLAEEKGLRRVLKELGVLDLRLHDDMPLQGVPVFALITALVRAVREDCAKVAVEAICPDLALGDNNIYYRACRDIAAAIRRGNDNRPK